MIRSRAGILSLVVAAGLAACGGGHDGGAPATPQASAARATIQGLQRNPVVASVDARLSSAKGEVDVWVQLDANSLARAKALMVDSGTGTKRALSSSSGEGRAFAAAMVAQRATVQAQQSATVQRMQALGGKELARVQVAHNAIALRIDAARLPELAKMPGVVRVRPVMHYEKHLGETVPYVGAAAVQAGGVDGTGVRVAVLDSGIDYTHKNLGGSGSAADWEAATADPTVLPEGLFPTAKVVGGFDFVGSTWSPTAGARSEDPNPIDDGPERGHGTHVADIIGGRSLDGTHKGMAPGVQLYAVKVCSSISSSCNGIALLKGMDYVLDPDGNPATDDAMDVVNLSLGSGYGQIEDDLTLAVSNAVASGVVVVASAGNSANRPYIVGSPSIAAGAISVAQTQVPSATAIPLLINAPASIAGVYGNTALLDWAPIGAGVTGDVVFIGRGCAADPLRANPAGKIALIDRGACNISEKVDRAANAGAIGTLIGLVAAGDAVSFSLGNGSNFVPSMVIQQSLSSSIKSRLAAGLTVNVSLSPTASIPLVGGMVGSSSRGPAVATHLVKPEIGAPGSSVSAVAGSGTGTEPFGGTSGAAPMVAGAAALVLQAHPGRTPLQVKAMLMNSAETTVYTNPATTPGGLAPITRIGSGELRVDRAIALTAAAWVAESQSAALSFGAVEADKQLVLTKTFTVQNFGSSPRTFTVTPSFRYADDEASGAVRVQVQGTVTVPVGGTATVPVRLIINPANLPAWLLNGGSSGGNGALLNGPEYDGYITLTSGSEKLSLPWHVLPRKAAAVTGARLGAPRGANVITLKNVGAEFGDYDYDVFSLIGTSAALPGSEFPAAGDNFATIDVRSVGVRYLPPELCGGNCLEFAISNYGRRSHPNYPAGFEVYVDTNNDGTDDYVIFNQEAGDFATNGQNRVYVASLPGGSGSSLFFTDADLNSGNLIFTVLLNDEGLEGLPSLGAPTSATLGISLVARDNYFTGLITDTVVGMKFTPGSPKFRVTSGVPFGAVPKGPLLSVPFTRNPAVTAAQSSETGLLFMYRRNAGNESQAFVIP